MKSAKHKIKILIKENFINEADDLGGDVTKDVERAERVKDVKGSEEQQKGVTDTERGILRKTMKILKKYAQKKELKNKVKALERVLVPLMKELGADAEDDNKDPNKSKKLTPKEQEELTLGHQAKQQLKHGADWGAKTN